MWLKKWQKVYKWSPLLAAWPAGPKKLLQSFNDYCSVTYFYQYYINKYFWDVYQIMRRNKNEEKNKLCFFPTLAGIFKQYVVGGERGKAASLYLSFLLCGRKRLFFIFLAAVNLQSRLSHVTATFVIPSSWKKRFKFFCEGWHLIKHPLNTNWREGSVPLTPLLRQLVLYIRKIIFSI